MLRALVGVIAVGLPGLLWAVDVRIDGSSVYVNEVKIHTFLTSSAGQEPSARAESAFNVLKAFKDGETVTKKASGKNWVVSIGKRNLIAVTTAEAKACRTNPQSLAAVITQKLASALVLPALAVDVERIDTPTDKTVVFHVTGTSARKAIVESIPPGPVKVTKSGGEITVKPLKAGSTVLKIRFNADSIAVPVAVRPYAFNSKQSFAAQVVGDPADKIVVGGAAASVVQTRSGVPAANQVWVKVLDASPLLVGQSKTFRARVKATGPGCYGYEGEVQVKVSNVGASIPRETELWYSNEPENIDHPGRLYWGELKAGTTARLLYHHMNTYLMPQVVRYMVANSSDVPAFVSIALGDSRPDKNPTRAGYVAGEQFMSKWVSRSAEVVQIPARSVVPVTVRLLARGETCSGLATLSLRQGGPDSVVVIGDSVLKQMLYAEWQVGEGVIGAWHAIQPRTIEKMRINLEGQTVGVFPQPFRDVRLDYEVGGKFGFTRIGDEPILNSASSESLQGNFGVIYDIQGTLTNPTPSPAEVELLFEASAGYGSGLFVLNGEFVRIGLIDPKREIVLASIKLPPGGSKPLRIQTIPLSGANYPVTLIVRPIGFESFRLEKR